MTNIDQSTPPVNEKDTAARLTDAAVILRHHAAPIIERLISIADGHRGKFSVFGVSSINGRIITKFIPNDGRDPAFLLRAFLLAIGKINETPGMNIYLVPALFRDDLVKGRGKESDVIGVLAIVPDFDGGHHPATRHARLPIITHAEVCTSPGNYHEWIFFDKPYPVEEVKPVIATLVNRAGADDCKSCEHGYRAPGTLNYPNKVKLGRGRSPEPVLAQISIRPDVCDEVTLDELKAAIVTKWPDATFDAQRAAAADADFDWGQRRTGVFNPLKDDEVRGALNNPKYVAGDPNSGRSDGLWAFFNLCIRRGHSPEEIVALLLDHTDTLCMGHYHDPVEDGVRADVKRAFDKFEGPPKASEQFAGVETPEGEADKNNSDANHENKTKSKRMSLMDPAKFTFHGTIKWLDLATNGTARPTTANTRLALQACGLKCGFDEFRGFPTVGGEIFGNCIGDMTDEITKRLCHFLKVVFGFEPDPNKMQLAIEQLCFANRYNPVTEYFDSLKWDGTSRVETLFIDHCGTPDTPLMRAISSIFLVAAVRRARHPGEKFDEVFTFESPQGWNKSSMLELLAGTAYFSDQSILKENEKTQAEHLRGKLIYEIGELVGLNKADVEQTKSFAARRVDRVRRVWAHYEVEQPRTCIMTATTNDTDYLNDDTGARRFWPIKVTRIIDLAKLAAVRDQLWAEAAHLEAEGFSIRLDQSLWGDAAVEQEARRLAHPWEDVLAQVKGHACETLPDRPDYKRGWHEERIHSATILTSYLGIEIAKQSPANGKAAKRIMQRLGWSHSDNIKIGNKQGKGFWRFVEGPMPEPATAEPGLSDVPF